MRRRRNFWRERKSKTCTKKRTKQKGKEGRRKEVSNFIYLEVLGGGGRGELLPRSKDETAFVER